MLGGGFLSCKRAKQNGIGSWPLLSLLATWSLLFYPPHLAMLAHRPIGRIG